MKTAIIYYSKHGTTERVGLVGYGIGKGAMNCCEELNRPQYNCRQQEKECIMELLLYENSELRYWITDTFESTMLVPIMKNMLHKAENDWDDYNEVYHCCRFIESVRKNTSVKMDFHYVNKGKETIGVGLMTYGDLQTLTSFPTDFISPDSTEKALVFNYFHVSPEGRGIGEHWLRDIILPFYAGKGFASVYVKSSHSRVFSLYKRLGERIASYGAGSDNGLYHREGEIFRISLLQNK